MMAAFASSILKSEKITDPHLQNSSYNELKSFLNKGISFSSLEQEDSSFQKNDSLIFTTDTFIAGRHFDLNDHPDDIARCMLRTSLCNMAACGTFIKGYLMALTLPQDLDSSWLPAFKATLGEEQDYFQICSLGGDIGVTSGPLTLTFTFVGVRLVRPKVQAELGDCIYVTGFLGDREMGQFLSSTASLEIQSQLSESDVKYFRTKYYRPDPHFLVVQRLLPFIHTCLSLGEGLINDVTHLCHNANLQAYINLKSIPRSNALLRVSEHMNLDLEKYCFLTGQDRELLFTAPVSEKDQISYLSHAFDLPITPIGYMGIRQIVGDKDYISWIGDDRE